MAGCRPATGRRARPSSPGASSARARPSCRSGRSSTAGCTTDLAPEVVAAYDAPFPDESYKEGARQFPALVPAAPDDPAHDANVAAWATLSAFDRPFLCCFSDSDPITRGGDRRFRELVPGARDREHVTVEGAGHFLQEDRGVLLADVLVAYIAATP